MRPIEFFDNGHDLNPDAVCFVQDETGEVFTYRDVRELTLRTANGLLASGFVHEARGAILSVNDAVAFTCALAFFRAGLAWVPLNPRNALEENIHAMVDFDCEVLFYHSMFEPMVQQIREAAPGIRLYVCVDKTGSGAPAFSDWVREYPADEVLVEDDPDGLQVIQPTGGTTGRSKGVRHSNRALSAMIMVQLAVTSFDDLPPVYLSAAPMTHAGGYICFPILARGGQIIVQRQISPQSFLAAISKYTVSILFLPPTVIYALLSDPDVRSHDYSSLRHFLYGAAPMSPDKLIEAMEVFGPVMTQMFGQSECLFPVTYLSPADHAAAVKSNELGPLSSCGKPAPFCRLAIMDDEGNLLGVNEVGEIVVRTPMAMGGYHKNPELTAEVKAHGWLHTGDVGYRDEKSFYYIVDRKKDMIISGGFNVFSAEVEKAVMAHPAVQDCAVVGVPHEKWGEEVKAVVELRPDQSVTEDEIVAMCKEAIGSVKAPKTVDIVDELPRSATGKVLKREVRDPYWFSQGRQVN